MCRLDEALAEATGNDVKDVVLTVKTTKPTVPVFHLDASLQDPVQGATYTTSTTAILDGQTDPGATVQIVGTTDTTTADANGDFSFSDLSLNAGPNTIVVQAIDIAGNTSEYSLTITSGPLMPPVISGQPVGGALSHPKLQVVLLGG